MQFRLIVFCLAAALTAFDAPFTDAGQPPQTPQTPSVGSLQSHRATYEISLEHTTPGSIMAARGRTVIEFRDACSAWLTTQRFIADMMDAEGKIARSDYSISSNESKDGRTMRFTVVDALDGKIRSRSAGTALVAPSRAGQAVMGGSKLSRFPLPAGTIFPTEHTLELIALARAGRPTLSKPVFQGGDKDELYSTVATIIAAKTAGKTVVKPGDLQVIDRDHLLKGVRVWPAIVSYYRYGGQSENPEYEVASRLYENGIIGSMSLIYTHFTLRARLIKVEKLAASCR